MSSACFVATGYKSPASAICPIWSWGIMKTSAAFSGSLETSDFASAEEAALTSTFTSGYSFSKSLTSPLMVSMCSVSTHNFKSPATAASSLPLAPSLAAVSLSPPPQAAKVNAAVPNIKPLIKTFFQFAFISCSLHTWFVFFCKWTWFRLQSTNTIMQSIAL